MLEWRRLASVSLIANQWLSVEQNTYETPAGIVSDYYVLRRSDFVLIVAVDGKTLLLIRQYRPATDKIYLALPGGYIENDEAPLAAAQRELWEETGAEGEEWSLLGKLDPLPGYVRSTAHVFQCKVKIQDTRNETGDAIEGTELVRVEQKTALEMIRTGEIIEMQSVAAILLACLKQDREQHSGHKIDIVS